MHAASGARAAVSQPILMIVPQPHSQALAGPGRRRLRSRVCHPLARQSPAQNTTGARRRRLSPVPRIPCRLGTRVEHGDGAPVLRPARYVIAYGDRPLLAVRDGVHALRLDAARGEEFTHGLPPPRTQAHLVLPLAPLLA